MHKVLGAREGEPIVLIVVYFKGLDDSCPDFA